MKRVLFILFVFGICVAQASQLGNWTVVRESGLTSKEPHISQFISLDSLHCWAFGLRGGNFIPVVYSSKDGGIHWDSLLYNPDPPIRNLNLNKQHVASVPDADHLYFVTDRGRIVSSSDAGKKWTVTIVDSTIGSGYFFNDILFEKGTGKGRVLGDTILYATIDGGQSWSKRIIPYPTSNIIRMRATHFFSLDTFYVCYGTYTNDTLQFCQTFDGGQTWNCFPQLPLWIPNEMTFVSMSRGWMVGSLETDSTEAKRDKIYRTIDGGRTWEVQVNDFIADTITQTYLFGLTHVDFADSLNGLAVGNYKILRTTDGGIEWKIEDRMLDTSVVPWVSAIHFNSSTTALCAYHFGTWAKWSLTGTSDAVESTLEIDPTSIQVSPNPCNDRLIVKLNSHDDSVSAIRVVSLITGEVVMSLDNVFNEPENLIMLDISTLSSGSYLIQTIGKGIIKSSRFIVCH